MAIEVEPAVIVIFGASGDLTNRKLIPALHTLGCEGFLPDQTRVVGVARTEMENSSFRFELFDGVKEYSRSDPKICDLWNDFQEKISYISGDYDDPQTYRRLAEKLDELENERVGNNRLYYLATPPFLYPIIVERLGEANLNRSESGWVRLIIEKPFGHDLASAKKLNRQVHAVFGERQVYRIDHYLGKETVQNILALRFSNAVFEPLWNRNYIDHVQITVSEKLGIGHRGSYYDKAGVLRDMFQNHLLQLLTLMAMEPPALLEADALRDEKVKVLRTVSKCAESVRAQYSGYRQEKDVAPDSSTPTYATLKFFINNWRWQGVPFYVRSGKGLKEKYSEISIQFKEVPHLLFRTKEEDTDANVLSLCLQPDEGIKLYFAAKVPGASMRTRTVAMGFRFADDFGDDALPDAYERLLLDAMQGDASLFARADEIELAWSIVDSIISQWESSSARDLVFYDKNSEGPAQADDLIEKDGRSWRSNCGEFAENSQEEGGKDDEQ